MSSFPTGNHQYIYEQELFQAARSYLTHYYLIIMKVVLAITTIFTMVLNQIVLPNILLYIFSLPLWASGDGRVTSHLDGSDQLFTKHIEKLPSSNHPPTPGLCVFLLMVLLVQFFIYFDNHYV